MDMKDKTVSLTEIIRTRKSIYADAFIPKEIPDQLIKELIINATWAPNYKCTEPWRFIVLRGQHRTKIGEFMLKFYKEKWSKKDVSPSRYEQILNYPKHATMVAIIMQRSQKVQIKEWEELAAVACAVQNLWLSCHAEKIGAYWDSSEAAIQYTKALRLKSNEQSLGIFYMGYYKNEQNPPKRRRKLLRKKLSWLD